MSRYAKILSTDMRFSKMLYLELANCGIDHGDLPESSDLLDENYVIADLDQISHKELESYASEAILIGFTKNDPDSIKDKCELCAAIFKRPFLMTDFLSFFYDGQKEKKHNRKIFQREDHKKLCFLTVDPNSSSAFWGDKEISLSDNEYKVLNLLCQNRGDVVEREQIYSILGAEEGNMGDVYICHLRRKIDNKLGLKLIYTIRGKGYMLKN